MHIFCTECGKHIDVSLEELENQEGHLVCPQCLAEIDVDKELFNGKADPLPKNDQSGDDTPATRQVPSNLATPPELPATPPPIATPQAQHSTAASTPPPVKPQHIDDVLRYCKHCGAFLKEGVNFCPKCGKYVRVSPPGSTMPPARRTPANSQSTYHPPQAPSHQASQVKQQRTSRTGAQRRTTRSKNNGSSTSKFSLLSITGCLTATIIAVALFFIIYIIIGVNYE